MCFGLTDSDDDGYKTFYEKTYAFSLGNGFKNSKEGTKSII